MWTKEYVVPLLTVLQAAPAQDQNTAVAAWLAADLPTDPASIVAILLCLGCVAAVMWFGRNQQPPT